ncbi:hypothetical protein ACFW1M_34815 [Streptomyces inhibens]|uniref:hypothetical protein n=1 Tax=Streptomyces inhibens TaxID=2293571 RepID=UPI0036CD7698
MSDEVQTIVAKLSETEDTSTAAELAERQLTAGNPAFLADLGIQLLVRYGFDAGRIWQYRIGRRGVQLRAEGRLRAFGGP